MAHTQQAELSDNAQMSGIVKSVGYRHRDVTVTVGVQEGVWEERDYHCRQTARRTAHAPHSPRHD